MATAYVGPGAGLTAIGTVLALIGAVLLGIFGFVWYPIKRLLRRKAAVEGDEIEDDAQESAVAADQIDAKKDDR